MNLLIKIVDAPMVPGGKAAVLCDAEGNIFPGQSRCALECEVGSPTVFTVSFEVDGKQIKLVG